MSKLKIKNLFNVETVLLSIILLIFLLFGLYILSNIRRGTAPDENYHINVSTFYSETLLIPENSEETHRFGDITRIPYLSFWLNARLINLNITGFQDFKILRVFNLFQSILGLIVIYFISKEVINKKFYNLLPPFLFANTLMFAFLSASVNYDNLSNLFIFLTIYFFIKYFKTERSLFLLYLLIFQVLAIMTKFSVFPVIFIQLILLPVFIIRKSKLKVVVKEVFSKYKILLFISFIVVGLGITLYGGNMVRYGQVQVQCDRILDTEDCLKNAVYARDKDFGRATFSTYPEFVEILDARVTPVEYLFNWSMQMIKRVYGIFGHQRMLMDRYLVNLYFLLSLILVVNIFRKWSKKDFLENNIIIMVLFYLFVLLVYQNFRTYFRYNVFDLALQGRYLFPVLPIIYLLMIRYLVEMKNKWLRGIIIFMLIIFFFYGCIPFFFSNLTDTWFAAV